MQIVFWLIVNVVMIELCLLSTFCTQQITCRWYSTFLYFIGESSSCSTTFFLNFVVLFEVGMLLGFVLWVLFVFLVILPHLCGLLVFAVQRIFTLFANIVPTLSVQFVASKIIYRLFDFTMTTYFSLHCWFLSVLCNVNPNNLICQGKV